MQPTIGLAQPSNTAKVIPLLAAVCRVEELGAGLAMRLDPIIQHTIQQNVPTPETPSHTVTARLHALGDQLQYLLDNIEL